MFWQFQTYFSTVKHWKCSDVVSITQLKLIALTVWKSYFVLYFTISFFVFCILYIIFFLYFAVSITRLKLIALTVWKTLELRSRACGVPGGAWLMHCSAATFYSVSVSRPNPVWFGKLSSKIAKYFQNKSSWVWKIIMSNFEGNKFQTKSSLVWGKKCWQL